MRAAAVKDVDFERNQIVVRDSKGAKDRVTMLPERLEGDLRREQRRGSNRWRNR